MPPKGSCNGPDGNPRDPDLVVVTWALRTEKHPAPEQAARELADKNPEAFARLAAVIRESVESVEQKEQ